ncbi:hypothetical protein [Streptomyces collinus]|uniref:Secreted protein n=1 Tax=Streptomyces collinus (strain DSM 40733 / Tue 365) TaxID=1214242 RepID=S5VHN7_STRC3|nr:hypothetical protein [Streptomyces collinus]AGS70042.1 hypothetical protein B446_16120 [Streptomyces collinus Tu 365]UJA08681.1 hypothetical protein HGI10_26030 [Streptomyces collinus]UJA16455.1 hypothetical protein HGI09_38090 [Streptomyces collinus]
MGMKGKIAFRAVVGVVVIGVVSANAGTDGKGGGTGTGGKGSAAHHADDDVTGTAVVTVRATDAYFRTTGCGDRKPTG